MNNPRLEELRKRAADGDRFAAEAVRCYATDAELERAEQESRDQDYTS